MENNNKNQAIEELKYRLILIQNSEDDLINQAYLIQKLKETYIKHNIDISSKIQTYLQVRIKRIRRELNSAYKEKTEEYEKLRKRHDKKNLEHKRKDIFGW